MIAITPKEDKKRECESFTILAWFSFKCEEERRGLSNQSDLGTSAIIKLIDYGFISFQYYCF